MDQRAYFRVPDVVWEGICYTFNWPVAMVTQLHIPYWVGLDAFYGRGVGEFMGPGEMLIWHMRVAVPVYMAIFYLPGIASLTARAISRKVGRGRSES